MKELTGTERALEALGEALKRKDSELNIANCTIENYREQVATLKRDVKMLEEALHAAENERDAALKAQRVAENRLEAVVEEYRRPTLKLEVRGKKERGVPC